MKLNDLSVKEFAQITYSDAPAPGGGSVSALAGALAASLSGMVANLSIGKKKYQDYEEDLKLVSEKANQLKEDLLVLVEEDSDSFNLFMEALSLPKESEEEKAYRKSKMQEGLKVAAQTPLKTASKITEIYPLLNEVVNKGNQNAITDAMVSAMLARSATLGALYNVEINLQSIEDKAYCAELDNKCKELASYVLTKEKEILALCEIDLF